MNYAPPNIESEQAPVEERAPADPAMRIGNEAPSLLQQYVRIAIRWRWIIAGCTFGSLLLGLILTFLMTPQYTAVSTIEISRDAGQVTEFQGVERDTSDFDQEFYQTQYGLLKARSLAERVATNLRLVDDPAFFEMYGVDLEGPTFGLTDGRFAAEGRADRLRIAGGILLGAVEINPERMSRLVNIAATSPDPEFSARVATSWAENFIAANLARKSQATSYGRDQLQRQLAEYQERLNESQRQLVAYASNEQIINLPSQGGGDGNSTPERSIIADDLAALNAALAKATTDRIDAESRARQANAGGSSIAALSNQAINSLRQRRAELAAEYQRLMVRFEPSYPAAQAIQSQINELDQAIGREERRVSQSIEGEYRAAAAREAALQSRVDQLKDNFLDLRRRSIQYDIFQQEVETNRALYDGLLQRFKEIGVAGGVGVNNVAIVDTPEIPQAPSSPRLLLNILVSLMFGSVLGAALAFLLEQLDDTIADPSEVERRFGLPLLGLVPKLEDTTPTEALQDRKSDLVDAYLAIQTSLGFTTEQGVPRTFAVTSTRPAEGKSTSALALAAMRARAGKRVLLIDGDMRSPSVHHLGGVDHKFGLSNFLSGDDNIDDMTFEMQDLGFDAMSAGPIPPNAAELLTGGRLSMLLDRLLDRYDHVIIDSPPVMGLADAPLIARNVEGVIYAIESHGIRSSLVKTALGRLQRSNVRNFGAILTKFEARKAHYEYGYEYGYNYGRSSAEQETA